MKALRSANAQTTLSKRQQEQQAKIKKIAIAILIAILIFLALLMLESNLISDETYTYVITSNSYISAGTVVNEDNYNTLFSATAISQRQSDEYNKITLDPDIPNFKTAEDAMNALKEAIDNRTYTQKNLSKMQYVNVSKDLTNYAQYIESSTTTTYYAKGTEDMNYHRVQVIDPMDVQFSSADAIRSQAGEIREGDIVELGYTRVNSFSETEYVNGWSKDYDEPVLITREYVDEILRREGYYTIYEYQVTDYDTGNIKDSSGNIVGTADQVGLQRATIYVSDQADTGGVFMKVVEPRQQDAAGNHSIKQYETYFNGIQPGYYILTDTGWELYDFTVDYSGRQVTPSDYDVNKHFMDLSAVHVQAVLVGPGQTIGENVVDQEEAVPQVYKLILSKQDIEQFYKFISAGSVVMTKIMNTETDPHLVQPDYDAMYNDIESIYVKIKSAEISHNHVELDYEDIVNSSMESGAHQDGLVETSNVPSQVIDQITQNQQTQEIIEENTNITENTSITENTNVTKDNNQKTDSIEDTEHTEDTQ